MIITIKVTNGVAWCPVSHRVSPKGFFDCLEAAKITAKFFLRNSKNGFLLSGNVNEVIRAILNFFFFYGNILHAQKAQSAYKRTKTKKQHFYMLKNPLRGRKSLIHLFPFCAFAWLRLCAFYAFYAFCACKIFS